MAERRGAPRSRGAALLAGLLLIASIGAPGTEARAEEYDHPAARLVGEVTRQVLERLRRDPELKARPEKLYEFVRTTIAPYFDGEAMAKLALGKHWRRAGPEERQAFVAEFRELLIRTYGTALALYSDQKVRVLPTLVRESGDRVVVRMEVEQTGARTIPIDYAMHRAGDTWKAYDVRVNGVSLVVNYRSSFASIIRRSGMQGLLEELRRKRAEPQAPIR